MEVLGKEFNRELFMDLCEKYGVKFSKEYSEIMLKKDDGSIQPLIPEEILGTGKEDDFWRKLLFEIPENNENTCILY